jgi:hypothetical protein
MRSCTAHGEESFSFNLKDLSPHQVNYMGAYKMDISFVPLLDGKSIQTVKIFVVSINEKSGKRLLLQPIQPVFFLGRIRPYSPEVSSNDNIVAVPHLFLLGKAAGGEPVEVTMGIASNINHDYAFLKCMYNSENIRHCYTWNYCPG